MVCLGDGIRVMTSKEGGAFIEHAKGHGQLLCASATASMS
jgi:hypothetical protein